MPTYLDETLHDRYAREHADHLARLAKMTPEQIAEIELSLHNALAEVDRLRAKASQGGEAAAMLARFGQIEFEITQGKHTAASVFTQMRTAALYTHPADQLADDLTMVKVPREFLERAERNLCSGGEAYQVQRELRALLNGGQE